MREHFVFCFLASALPLLADTTFEHDGKSAWSANAGWILFRHDRPASPDGVVFGDRNLSGHAYAANFGWINFGDGSPANGQSYSNTGNDHGVNHDGAGNLTGFAWAANAGWINFGWAAPNDANRPRVDLQSGEFSGYAWGANLGWLNLGTGLLKTRSMDVPDTDGDGISDPWEISHTGNLSTMNATSNQDGDSYTDFQEYQAMTDPLNPESQLRITHIQPLAPGGTTTTLTWTSNPARLYRIQTSTDVGISDPWKVSALDPALFLPDAATTTTRETRNPSSSRRFYRISPVVPLQP